uniref:Zn(2)-C6 fungal-type domain-containing protein n=1 Tax=Ganoderma boninense TaxID=34458 RepID=A0A5K1K318_9APHY|nr:Zn(2)-C6 fungal-type domain-containing protein [Ganoderma boninense]
MADPAPPDQAASNSLGLDLEALKIKDGPDSAPSAPEDVPPASADASPEADETKDDGESKDEAAEKKELKEKKKPYVNPDRVKTGGAQRKPSEEELAERMARIREQNEKIKQRRLDVQADEDEYKKKQEADRAKLAKQKKVQESVDKAREQNARRKMDKIQGREWDSGKPTREWNKPKNEQTGEDGEQRPQPSINIRGAVRGGGRGRGGGGRGRGRGVTSPTSEKNEKEAATIGAAEPSAPATPVAASS